MSFCIPFLTNNEFWCLKMNFGVSKTIENYQPQLFHNYFPVLSSEPALNLTNPGISLQLYSEVVPLTSQHAYKRIEQKIEEENEALSTPVQDGKGIDEEKLKKSLLHPRPIKTEILEVFKSEKKRKAVDKQGHGSKKLKSGDKTEVSKMKFQFE